MDRRFAILSVVLVAAGCQQSPYVSSHLEILGAERRALEVRVLDLEFELDRAQKRLIDYQDGDRDATSRGSRSTERSSRDSGSQNGDRGDDLMPPSIQIPGLGDDSPPTLEPPRVNEGRPADSVLPNSDGDSVMTSPRYQQPTRPIAITPRAPGDPRITHIELNPTLTGGTDFDRKSGDDGLIIVLEPRNADNEFVPLAGPITVVLLDYAKRNQGSAALIDRWKIDAPTVHKLMLNDQHVQGIQLRLPWSDRPPENSKLRLDVRYTTADGRHLDARSDVVVSLPGQYSARWTPRAPSSSSEHDPSPNDGQAPVNIARQPDMNESAGSPRMPTVTQSAFTIVSPATEPVSVGPTSQTGSSPIPPETGSRPTWQPIR
ncbi:MAG: hypothetical protein QF918_04915 [Pirellulaceae bacterium]|jgi:hypothetical protein|nr:hypothetical protein [Pirellulaceae bacterium]